MLFFNLDQRKAFDWLRTRGVATLEMKMAEFGGITKNKLAFQRGSYVFYDSNGKKIDVGKYVTLLNHFFTSQVLF